jgi:hypothetical protein
VRLLFALALGLLALLLVALLLWVRPLWAETPRCLTSEEKTLCADGTRAVSSWHRTLARWEMTVTLPSPDHRDTMLPQPKALRR